jgi:rhodanese-related sulfurtransferase
MQEIKAHELKSRLDARDPVIVVDTRTQDYYDIGHIPGAVLGTSDTILEKAATLIPDRQASIVVYCGSLACKRSLRSAQRLESVGYSHVLRYAEGMEDWEAHGFQIERSL